jgi:hypothetical protein
MIDDAVSKLKNEMAQNANDTYVKVIGEFLLKHLELNPGSAEKVMNDGKTIKASLNEMQKEARKKQVNNCAVFSDQEGFEIVLKYFGIKPGQVLKASYDEKQDERQKTKKSANDFDVKLEDLL